MSRRVNVAGIVVNGVAAGAAVIAFPYLAVPLLKLGFVGLLAAAPVTLVVMLVSFVVIDLGPLIGVAVSLLAPDRTRVLAWITGIASLVSLIFLVAFVAFVKTQIDLDNDGRARGPKPENCKPKNTDGTAIGRPCDADSGTAACPSGYWCMEETIDRPETTQCMIYCTNDCECPHKFKCVYSKCTR